MLSANAFESFLTSLIVWIASLFTLFGLTGCAEQMADAKFWDGMDRLAEFARANDVAGSVHVTVSGDGSVYAKESFGLDTGLSAKASFQFNAADAEPGKTEEVDGVVE